MTFLADTMSMDLLWRNALGAIPLAIMVALICRFVRCRPSTRHALWFIVLLALLAPPLLPSLDFSDELGAPRFFAQIGAPVEPAPLPTPTQATPVPHGAASPSTSSDSSSVPSSPYSTRESAASTASERSPTSLRASASHPNSSPEHTVPPLPQPQAPVAAASTPSQETSKSVPDSSSVVAMDSRIDSSRSASNESTAAAVEPPQRIARRAFGSTLNWLDLVDRPNVGAAETARRVADQSRPADSNARDQASSPTQPSAASVAAQQLSAWAAALEWRDWLVRVAAARDSIVSLAPIPTTLWAAGVALIVLVMLVRVWRFQRLLRRATPAGESVVDLVQDCAEAIGLRTMPRVLMTERNVSPLVWCGARRVLLLPAQLWSDLDDTARRAVLLHELAHLKRRDHWVCWVEMAVCTLYWWNPIAWWVRHRLRDEADYCCDAWVTAVLPESRTAYARALLTTRQYLNLNPSRTDAPAPPGLALGATSARTKRFARRLTMVMTERSTPRLSVSGSALALLLAGGAWLATPLWACPPEESTTNGVGPSAPQAVIVRTQDKPAKAAKAPKAPKTVQGQAIEVPTVVVAPHGAVSTTTVAPRSGSTYEQHMQARDHAGHADAVVAQAQAPNSRNMIARTVPAGQSGGDGLEARMERLEGRMDRLTAQLERLLGGGGSGGGGMTIAVPAHPGAPAAAAHPHPPAAPTPPAAPAPGQARGGMVLGEAGALAPLARAPGASARGGQAPAGAIAEEMRLAEIAAAEADGGEQIVRFYPLPGDKAAALFEFMRRDDIPVLVAQRDDGIEVHGTAAQHRAFAAFIMIINPESRIDGFLLESSGADARAGVDASRRALLEAELAAAARAGGARAQIEGRMRQAQGELERARRTQILALEQAAKQQHKQLDQQRKQMEKQREQLLKQAAELQEKAEQMQRKAQEMREKAVNAQDDAQRAQLEAQADAIEAQADALEAQADAQEEAVDAQIAAMEEQLEAQEESLEDQLEAQEEAMEAQLEAQMEALEAELESALAAIEDAEAVDAPSPASPANPR